MASSFPKGGDRAMWNQIGESAGVIWKTLKTKGPTPIDKLLSETKMSSDLLHMALGWLYREDKVKIDTTGKKTVVALK
jgi:hypothetical protein